MKKKERTEAEPRVTPGVRRSTGVATVLLLARLGDRRSGNGERPGKCLIKLERMIYLTLATVIGPRVHPTAELFFNYYFPPLISTTSKFTRGDRVFFCHESSYRRLYWQ